MILGVPGHIAVVVNNTIVIILVIKCLGRLPEDLHRDVTTFIAKTDIIMCLPNHGSAIIATRGHSSI